MKCITESSSFCRNAFGKWMTIRSLLLKITLYENWPILYVWEARAPEILQINMSIQWSPTIIKQLYHYTQHTHTIWICLYHGMSIHIPYDQSHTSSTALDIGESAMNKQRSLQFSRAWHQWHRQAWEKEFTSQCLSCLAHGHLSFISLISLKERAMYFIDHLGAGN